MWPVAIFLMLVVGFYWFAFYISVIAWLNAVGHLLRGNFIRASIGCGMLFWWQETDVIPDPWDFDKWLRGSAVIVGIGALGTFARFYNRHQRAVQAVTPFEPAPVAEPTPVVLNINIELSPHADRHAVHDDLAALASALRDAIGAGQGPRQIPGSPIIDQ